MRPDAARREFLQSASAAALLALLDPPHLLAAQEAAQSAPAGGAARPLLAKLRFHCATPLKEMRAFYQDRLGLRVRQDSDMEITFAAGRTDVTFTKIEASAAPPSYHFAFNIPENKIRSAREWQLERSKLIRTPENLRDPEFPDDVRHFRAWNAHSVFFWDPAGNLVEYIARHELKNAAEGAFSSRDILCASEIGMVIAAEDQEKTVRALQTELGLSEYAPEKDRFWTLGDANGLLLFLPRGPREVDPDRKYEFQPFPTEAMVRGRKTIDRTIAGYPHRIDMRERTPG